MSYNLRLHNTWHTIIYLTKTQKQCILFNKTLFACIHSKFNMLVDLITAGTFYGRSNIKQTDTCRSDFKKCHTLLRSFNSICMGVRCGLQTNLIYWTWSHRRPRWNEHIRNTDEPFFDVCYLSKVLISVVSTEYCAVLLFLTDDGWIFKLPPYFSAVCKCLTVANFNGVFGLS